MARRSPPERIHQVHREVAKQRLIGEGQLPEGAEGVVTASDIEAGAGGREPDERWWAEAWRGMAERPAVARTPLASEA